MKNESQSSHIPAILVVFGATGDLTRKKIVPSLWYLFEKKRLPKHLSVIGFSRKDLSDAEFKNLIREAIEKRAGGATKEENLSRFLSFFSYHTGTFENEDAFHALFSRIAKTESLWGVCANKLFYFAVPPTSYEIIFKNLAAANLNLPRGGDSGWSRVLIEKPFGENLASGKKLQSLLSSYFKEEQIYRIDHYLFKEIVQGIENFRFSNNLFENAWDNTMIERIDIRLLESIGVEERGRFYDSVGALRDVGQNHLLTMLAAIAMEYPKSITMGSIRKNRASILETLDPWTDDKVKQNTRREQYRGYKEIETVRSDSEMETYFALKTELLHHRWSKIPIFMEAGKRMAEARKEIVLTLKHPRACLLCETGPHEPNRIVFRLEPNDEIIIHFWTKKPGFDRILEERVFSFFLYEKETKTQYVEEYAKVLDAAMQGNQMLFISHEEVEASWKFTDSIIEAWKRNIVPLTEYEPATTPSPKMLQKTREIAIKQKESLNNEIGIIGLGKMGANLARRLYEKGWKVIGFNRTPEAVKKLESEGIIGAYSLPELTQKLSKPRAIWLMVSHQAVDAVLDELAPLLEKGDTIIDGGNSFYKKSIRRDKELAEKGINFLDIGVSGGPEGARSGACLMIGGERTLFEKYERLFKDISVQNGYGYMGKSGAGHFVKMVHNGIEYGIMQAIGEGFAILKKSKYDLDLNKIADIYNHGSVIQSRLVGWLKNAFDLHSEDLKDVSGSVKHTGEGEWTVKTAEELEVKARVIKEALEFRIQSEKNPDYTGKILSALREQFGHHNIN